MRQIYTILFDLDGTIVDTAPDLMAAHNHVMKKFGHREKELSDIKLLAGKGSWVMMQKSFLYDYFDVMLSTDDVTNPKPNPEIYETAIQRLGLDATEVLIVEDNENGIKAARGSGAHVLVVEHVDDVNYMNLITKIHSIASEVS